MNKPRVRYDYRTKDYVAIRSIGQSPEDWDNFICDVWEVNAETNPSDFPLHSARAGLIKSI